MVKEGGERQCFTPPGYGVKEDGGERGRRKFSALPQSVLPHEAPAVHVHPRRERSLRIGNASHPTAVVIAARHVRCRLNAELFVSRA